MAKQTRPTAKQVEQAMDALWVAVQTVLARQDLPPEAREELANAAAFVTEDLGVRFDHVRS